MHRKFEHTAVIAALIDPQLTPYSDAVFVYVQSDRYDPTSECTQHTDYRLIKGPTCYNLLLTTLFADYCSYFV